jgi:hypothetical protein
MGAGGMSNSTMQVRRARKAYRCEDEYQWGHPQWYGVQTVFPNEVIDRPFRVRYCSACLAVAERMAATEPGGSQP